jgi:transposase-like protein
MFHPSCPHCGSRKTIKYALPRWKCTKKNCGKTFTLKRQDNRDRHALNAYILDRATYARLGERWKVNRSTAYRRVQKALKNKSCLLKRTRKDLKLCDGICVLDAKHIRVKGKHSTIFVAWDRGLGKPIHYSVHEEGEKELWYWKMLLELKRIGYGPKAFVSDGILVLKEFLREQYPNLPHQRCTVHVYLNTKSKIAPGKVKDERKEYLLEEVRDILWSKSLRSAKQKLYYLYSNFKLNKKEQKALEDLWKILPECFVCRDPKWLHLNLPRSSNSIENVMGQIEARLKTRRGPKGIESTNLLVNELLLQVKRQVIK